MSLPPGGLTNHFMMNFNLLWYHKIPVDWSDNMMPWERDIYLEMLFKKVEEENQKELVRQSQRRARGK